MVIPTIFKRNKYIPTSLFAGVMGLYDEEFHDKGNRMRMIDLFSGLGGASEAMLQSPDWEVIRVEKNKELLEGLVPATLFKDVKNLTPDNFWHWPGVDLIWASPPCTEFSNGFNSPRANASRAGIEYAPDLSLLETTIEFITKMRPTFWCIENVAGAIKYFEPYLGSPTQKIGSFFLWHNMPEIIVPRSFKHSKVEGDLWSDDPMRKNKKGKVPYTLSNAVRIACESPTLDRWQ